MLTHAPNPRHLGQRRHHQRHFGADRVRRAAGGRRLLRRRGRFGGGGSQEGPCEGGDGKDRRSGEWLGSLLLRLPVAFICFLLPLVSPARV